MPQSPGFLKQVWHKFKALRLPWRRHYLIGADLVGNTFWEFKDALHANRWRRIVKYPRSTHYADIKISPQWHQWLRHTRQEAPSLHEQQLDMDRQAAMKELAARADERWQSVPSYLDAPRRSQSGAATAIAESKPDVAGAEAATAVGDGKAELRGGDARRESPWKQAPRGGPSENWQPQSWTPGAAQKRR